MGLFSKKTKDSKPEAKKEEVKKTSKVVVEKKTVKNEVKPEKKEAATKDLYKEEAKKEEKAVKSKKTDHTGNSYKVLAKPLVTEKATTLSAENKYVFEVSVNTNKIEVAKAIEEVYGIKPVAVNIVKMKGKKVIRGRITGKRKDWKKAIITLPKGKSIQIYEGV